MQNKAYRTETIEHNGHSFRVEYLTDNTQETPWEWSDGHGTVSEWTSRDKKPGELVLCSDCSSTRYYDMQGAIKTAKEGWSCDSVLPTDTPGQKAVKAAQADYEYLRAWCQNDWWYACLHVTLLDTDGEELEGYDDYLGGVEDGYYRNTGDYAASCAVEIADGILARYEIDQDAELVNELHHVKDHALFAMGII
jgi:hypothetical protein